MRSRQIRLVVALVVASLLGTMLVYTAVFAGSTRTVQVHELRGAGDGSVRLNGRVAQFAGDPSGTRGLRITLADNRDMGRPVEVFYHGQVPDAFRRDRSVLVDGRYEHGVFVAKRDSLSTRCPSKYSAQDKGATNPGA
jgi:cytochrome c-type biogenesis protein CcmE